MAVFAATTAPTRFFPSSDALSHPLRSLTRLWSDWNNARITRKALSRLTARELDDIGLVRSDIDRIVAGSYR